MHLSCESGAVVVQDRKPRAWVSGMIEKKGQTGLRFKLQQKFLWPDVQKHSLQDLVWNSHTFKTGRGRRHFCEWRPQRRCDHHRFRGSQVTAVPGTTAQAAKAKWSAPCLPSPPSATWPNANADHLVNIHELETGVSPLVYCDNLPSPISSPCEQFEETPLPRPT